MMIRVLLFGPLRELVGVAECSVDVPEDGTAGDVVRQVRQSREDLGGALWATLAVAVNGHYVAGTTRLRNGDVVALLPPVSGG